MPKRVDINQKEIVEVLRKLGCSVAVTSMVGKGFPDIVVGRNGKNWLLEIKDGNQPPSKRSLTDYEFIFHENWKGQIAIVNNVEQAIEVINDI